MRPSEPALLQPRLLLVSSLTGLSLLTACLMTEPATTVEQVCARVMECHWGWASQDQCEEGFLTECSSPESYLVCMAGSCVQSACEPLADCEARCWETDCQQ